MNNQYSRLRLDSKMKECQTLQLKLLTYFHQICEKHNLEYWLDGGTLLGAIRHSGFIPWDDDIDVAMPTTHYQEFLKVAQQELPEGIFLQTKKSDCSYNQDFAKLINLNSLYLSPEDDLKLPYQKGIYIDIFEFIEYPTVSRKLIRWVALRICYENYFIKQRHKITLGNAIKVLILHIKLPLLKIFWFFLNRFKDKKKYISNVISDNGYGIVHLRDDVYPLTEITFEGLVFKAPGNPDGYLRDLYGDYMMLPAPENRKSHAIYIEPVLYADE